MDTTLAAPLVGSEIHGFHTLADLDVPNMTEDAKTRWLRPNEIHAILCNHKGFSIHVKPVHLPTSGSVLLFDRKMLRNFRKDGHGWKKKNDGKTVKEAHEHLKVGNEERIHVYYAHGQDNPTFVRRCYWLLDKSLEHIVLVHYRETQEGLPGTPVNSNSSSVSDQSTPWVVPEDLDSGVGLKRADSLSVRNHEKRLHEINTLEWDELLVTNDVNESSEPLGYDISVFNQQNQVPENGSLSHVNTPITYNLSAEMTPFANLSGDPAQSINSSEGVCNQTGSCQVDSNSHRQEFSAATNGEFLDVLVNEELPNQESFGRWINSIMIDSPGSGDCHGQESSNSSNHDSFGSPTPDHELHPVPEHIFNITDISPVWTYSNEKTKILVTGFFCEDYQHLAKSNMLCVCGGISVPAEIVQPGVYRCFVSQQSPGLVNFYMSIDGNKPISQVVNFEYRASSPEDQSKWEKFQLQLRLSYLLFSSSKSLNILSGKVSPHALNEAKKFACKTAKISNSWACLIKSIESGRANFSEAKNSLLEITFTIRLKEWLQERILEGCKTTERDSHGQGVIHLCAILGYTWAIHLFSWSGLSLDFRDKYGWTALHWAAYLGNEKMVAVLLSAGAKANMVTDPTPQNPGGCTASDLASLKGYAGLAAYLSEQALVSQFEDMVIAGNATGSLQRNAVDATNTGNLDEDQLCMKEYLAAYQTVADAAARIQAAFREHSLKVQTKAVLSCNPEDEARHIVAAMKIQHAFRIYETRKKMAAAARIQYRYRTWKMRRHFIKMRNQARKIQAAFRGFQVRRQYRKILWSVGVVEKAILRWRLKRKGLRGLHVKSAELVEDQMSGSETELDFYKISQKQSQERVERAVVTVQAMFRSKKVRQEYQRMKLAHSEATLEYERLEKPDPSMDI